MDEERISRKVYETRGKSKIGKIGQELRRIVKKRGENLLEITFSKQSGRNENKYGEETKTMQPHIQYYTHKSWWTLGLDLSEIYNYGYGYFASFHCYHRNNTNSIQGATEIVFS